MATLKENMEAIKLEKDTKILPENLRAGITAFGVEGTLQEGSTDIPVKLFETIEEMQDDPTAEEGDLAIVYKSKIQNATANSQFQVATFPDTVVLDTALTDYVEVRYRAVSGSMFDCWGQLDSSMFRMRCYTETGSVSIQYESSDGITYTRTDTTGNPVDFGTEIYYEYAEMWNDAIGKFIQVGGNVFEGLYKHNDHVLCSMGAFSITVLNNEITNVPLDNVSIPISVLENITQQIKTLRQLASVALTILLDSNKTDLIIVACTYTYDPYVANCPYIIYNDAQYLPTYHRAYKEVVHYKYNLETNILSEYEPVIENEISLQYYNSDGYVLKGIPFTGYLVCMTHEGEPHNINAYTWNGGTTYAEETTQTISCDYQYTGKYFAAPTQLTAIADYVYGKDFYGKNGVEIGTLQNKENLTKDRVKRRVSIWSNYSNNIVCPEDMTQCFKDMDISTIPLLDTSNVTIMRDMLYNCTNLTKIPLLDTSNVTDMNGLFYQCTNLIEIPQLNTSNVTNMGITFASCSSLITVPQLDTSKVTNIRNIFHSCTSLSDESLNNILAMCENATSYTGTKTLKEIGLTSEQATRCQSLSNWTALSAAGWTTGY